MDDQLKDLNLFQRNARKLVIIPMMAGASSVVFIRFIQASPIALGFFRLGFSVLLFGIPIVFGGYKEYKGITKKDFLFCVLSGFILFVHFICWFYAVNNTSVASAAVLCSLHPFVVLFATYVIFKKKVSIKAVIGVIIALTGGALVATGNQTLEGNFIFGDIAGFSAGVLFGIYFLMGRTMREKMPTLNYVFIVFSSCFVFFAIAMFVTATPFTGYRTEDYVLMFLIAVVCQGLAHAMYNWCMGYASSLYVSVFASVQSVASIFYGIIVFNEIPVILQWIGAAVAVAGLLYYNFNSQEMPKIKK